MLDLGIDLGFENDMFYMSFNSCKYRVDNFRQESEKQAQILFNKNPNQMLGLSSGLDSQIVLHSFYTQGVPLKCAFLYMPGFNDTEYNQIKILDKKYNLDLEVVDLNPDLYKDDLIEEFEITGIPPYQLLHKKFLSLLPDNYDFIQGVDGPDFIRKNNIWYIIQTANSFVNSRIRSFDLLTRRGKIVSWEKSPEVFLSLINDEIVKSFMFAYDNISKNGLSYKNDTEIPIIDYYDLYIKPYIYAKYWRDELEYFPKYQGPENVKWIMERKWHAYRKNLIVIPYKELINHLESTNGTVVKYYQRPDLE
jgi:hypothetical protein